jgi:hypothetical protein
MSGLKERITEPANIVFKSFATIKIGPRKQMSIEDFSRRISRGRGSERVASVNIKAVTIWSPAFTLKWDEMRTILVVLKSGSNTDRNGGRDEKGKVL